MNPACRGNNPPRIDLCVRRMIAHQCGSACAVSPLEGWQCMRAILRIATLYFCDTLSGGKSCEVKLDCRYEVRVDVSLIFHREFSAAHFGT